MADNKDQNKQENIRGNQPGTTQQTGSQPKGQPSDQMGTTSQKDDHYEEEKKHVGHRGGKTTDFGSTSYEED